MLLLAAFGLADKHIFSHLLSVRRRARPFQEITEQRKWCSSLPPRCPAELKAAFPTAALQPGRCSGSRGGAQGREGGGGQRSERTKPRHPALPRQLRARAQAAGQLPAPSPHLLVRGIAADPVPLLPGVRRQGEDAGEAGVDQLRAVGVAEVGLQHAAPPVKEGALSITGGLYPCKAATGILTWIPADLVPCSVAPEAGRALSVSVSGL